MYIVTCEYCKKEINTKGISAHLKKVHAVEFIDYLKTHRSDFPKYKDCEVCGTLIHAHSSGKSATCSVACSKQLRATWVGEKNPRKGIKHTNEGKRNISNAKKRYYEHNIHPMLGKQHTTDAKQKMSRTRIDNKLSVGERNGMYGKTHTPEAIRKIFEHRKMNTLERLVANVLDEHNIQYHFQYFINNGSICKSYDFLIKDTNILLEVDGDFWHGNPDTKHHYDKANEIQQNDKIKTELAESRGFIIYRYWESDIRKNPNVVIDKLR